MSTLCSHYLLEVGTLRFDTNIFCLLFRSCLSSWGKTRINVSNAAIQKKYDAVIAIILSYVSVLAMVIFALIYQQIYRTLHFL